MSAQQVFSVAEQANFQVWGSKVVVSPLLAEVVEPELAVEAEELPLLPQAARDRHITSVRINARNFFIGFPPYFLSCVYLKSQL